MSFPVFNMGGLRTSLRVNTDIFVLWNRMDVLVLPPGNWWAFQCPPCFVCSKHKCTAAPNKIKGSWVHSWGEIWCQEFCLAVFAVQNRPGTGREEDREIPQPADAAHGGEGIPQCCHGNRLSGCQHSHGSGRVSLQANLWDLNEKLGQEMLLCTEVDWWQVWSIFTPQTPLWKSRKISAFNWKLIFIFGY